MTTTTLHRNDAGRWTVARDGREYWQEYDSKYAAIRDAFTCYAWPGGYVVGYYHDADVHCGKCAARHYVLTGETMPGSTIDESEWDVYCGTCNELMYTADLCPDHGADHMEYIDPETGETDYAQGRLTCRKCWHDARPDVPHTGHYSHLSGTYWCDTCSSPYCELA